MGDKIEKRRLGPLYRSVFDAESFDTGCIVGAIGGVGARLSFAFVTFATTKKLHWAGIVATRHHSAFTAPETGEPGRAVVVVAAFVDAGSEHAADRISRALRINAAP